MTPPEALTLLRERLSGSQADRERCAREIGRVVPVIADFLAHEYGVRRSVLFGSIARGLASPDSDIDLAVEGLPPEQTFRAMARAADLAGRNVDLIPLEDVRPEVRAIIEQEGRVVRDDRRSARPGTPSAT